MTSDQTGSVGAPDMASLLSRAVERDFAAFGEIYARYLDRVYRYVYYQVRDQMTAEDVTEEVFLKAWKALRSYRGDERGLLPWLYRIARNQVIDTVRRERRLRPLAESRLEAGADPEEAALQSVRAEEVRTQIAALPARTRQVIILKFLEGLDNREIAEITGQKPAAIRIMQMRGLAKLAQSVSREVGDGR